MVDRSGCDAPWCFVDPLTCHLNHHIETNLDMNIARPFNTSFLPFSYATCGATVTPFSGNKAFERSLTDVVLRTVFLENSGGWLGSYKKPGNTSARSADYTDSFYGPVIDFFEKVQKRAHFVVNMTQVPQEAIDAAQTKSKFTQCVYATGMGYVDVCIGDFSITNSRNSITPFFTLENQRLVLVSKAKIESDIWESMMFVFAPFQGSVWACLAGLHVVIGLILAWQEWMTHSTKREKLLHRLEKVGLGEDNGSARNGLKYRNKENQIRRGEVQDLLYSEDIAVKKIKDSKVELLKHVGQSVYVSLSSFISGAGPQSLLTSWGAQITLLGLCWLVTVTFATYTGEAANLFGESGLISPFTNLEELKKKNLAVCMSHATAVPVAEVHPDLNIFQDKDGKPGLLKRGEIFANLEADHCFAAIIPAQDLEKEQSMNEHCNMIVFDPNFDMNVGRGYPISRRYARRLSWSMQQSRNLGKWPVSKKLHQVKSACPKGAQAVEGEGVGLSLRQMSGMFVSSLFFVFIGMTITVVTWCYDRKTGKINKKGKQRGYRNESLFHDTGSRTSNNPAAALAIEMKQGKKMSSIQEGDDE